MIYFYSYSITQHQHFHASLVQEASNILRTQDETQEEPKGKKIPEYPYKPHIYPTTITNSALSSR